MWRVLIFLGLIAIAAYGAVWLAGNPETLSVTWAGQEYSVPLAAGVVALIAVAVLISLLIGAIRGVVMMPSGLKRRARARRARKGNEAISRGIVAVGAGDIAAARRHAGEAERLLGQQPLALLLKAQAAQASGQRDQAEAAFRQMTQVTETRVLGLRGLYVEARRRGDAYSAREHAEEAARVAPAVEWANEAVLEGLSSDGDWAGAIRMIERRTSLGLIDRASSRRQRAVLLAADAMDRETSDPAGALTAAENAAKLAPDLVPAAVIAGRLLSQQGDLKRAARILETTWAKSPHPELAGAYLNLRPGDSALDRMRRAETLAKLSSWSDESRFAIARAAIEARELPRAREVIKPLLDAEPRPTVRLCMTMAEIEGRGGNPGGAREWLARAARAPRDKAWIADGVVSERWAPVSPVTGRLDAFAWETPPDLLAGSAEPDLALFEPEAGEEELPRLPVVDRRPAASPVSDAMPEDVPELAPRPEATPSPSPVPASMSPSVAKTGSSADAPAAARTPPPPVAEPAKVGPAVAPAPARHRGSTELRAHPAPAEPPGAPAPIRDLGLTGGASGPAGRSAAEPSGSPARGRNLGLTGSVAEPATPALAEPTAIPAPSPVRNLGLTGSPSGPAMPAPSAPPAPPPGRNLGLTGSPAGSAAPAPATSSLAPAPSPVRNLGLTGSPAEPAAHVPDVPSGPSVPPPARNLGLTGSPARPVAPDPEPVIFPVRHAPDDPGLEDGDRRQRFRLKV